MLPISNIRSPPTEPVLSAPLLRPAIKKFPVAAVGTICTPGSGSCQDCLPGDSNGRPDPRCHQVVPAIKPIAPDCSSGAPADPSCLESVLESAGSGDCQEGSTCEEASPASTECPGSPAGECGAAGVDEENKEKFERNKNEKCNSDICPPGPVRLSHDEEDDKRNSSSCVPGTADPLCWPQVDEDTKSAIKKRPADCSAGSDDPDCRPGTVSQCEAGSDDPSCDRGSECSPASSDPACLRRAEKGNQSWSELEWT